MCSTYLTGQTCPTLKKILTTKIGQKSAIDAAGSSFNAVMMIHLGGGDAGWKCAHLPHHTNGTSITHLSTHTVGRMTADRHTVSTAAMLQQYAALTVKGTRKLNDAAENECASDNNNNKGQNAPLHSFLHTDDSSNPPTAARESVQRTNMSPKQNSPATGRVYVRLVHRRTFHRHLSEEAHAPLHHNNTRRIHQMILISLQRSDFYTE
ncbi:hypothetical protein GOODEAATRI_030007 [Goodea atripinnis]|uniref:Uncharacterized protein n=1 Tax=Goodea atripinnis TaxID=208336 RepID=A0ABV0Q2Q1_9TELE